MGARRSEWDRVRVLALDRDLTDRTSLLINIQMVATVGMRERSPALSQSASSQRLSDRLAHAPFGRRRKSPRTLSSLSLTAVAVA
jgi:hypothetical protein